MNAGQRRDFEPIDVFWADYVRTLRQAAPPPAEPRALAAELDTLFGGLTTHELSRVDGLPITATCRGCRNNGPNRRESVCRTHVGSVCGTLEALLGVPVEASHEPGAADGCRIQVAVRGTAAGWPMVAWARRVPHVTPQATLQGFVVVDHARGSQTLVNEATWRILQEATEPHPAAHYARILGLAREAVARILDECHRLGWVHTSFAPLSDTPPGQPARASGEG